MTVVRSTLAVVRRPSNKAAVITKTKIVHLTSVHSPSDIRIFHKQCKTLANAGYDVVLVAPSSEQQITDSSSVRLISRSKSRWRRMTSTVWKVYKVALEEDATVYHFHDPELIIVSLLLKLHGKKVIYDVHEDVPLQVLSKPWIPHILRKLIGKVIGFVELLGARYFDGIVTATSIIANRFPENKTVTVQNFPILTEVVPNDSFPYDERASIVAFVGGLTIIQGIREMVGAIALLPEAMGVKLVLAGFFDPEELETDIKRMVGWERVMFLGFQGRDGVARLLRQARIGVVVYHPTPNYMEGYATKLFEYMASGIPVIVSDFPLWRHILSGIDCGVFVNPLDPEDIAKAIHWLLVHPKEAEVMGERGRQAVIVRYNWDMEAQKLTNLYRRIIHGPGPQGTAGRTLNC